MDLTTAKPERIIIRPYDVPLDITDEMTAPIFTYGFVKPHAYDRKNEIMNDIENLGHEQGRWLHLFYGKDDYFTEDKIRQHYRVHKDKPFFEELVAMMIGPTFQFVLTGKDAIKSFSSIVGATDPRKAGPHTLRRKYGQPELGIAYNAVHRSDSPASFIEESELHFDRSEMNPIFWERVDAYKKWLNSLSSSS